MDPGSPPLARIARDYGYTLADVRKLPDDRLMSLLRAELFHDDDAGNWHYRVPALHINGGGTASREEAEGECLDAVAFALQGDPRDFDSAAEAVTLDVHVAPAA